MAKISPDSSEFFCGGTLTLPRLMRVQNDDVFISIFRHLDMEPVGGLGSLADLARIGVHFFGFSIS
jgi:hypothetical protein